MKKQVKKWLTLTMAFALILGSISYNPLAANATAVSTVGTENSVTGNDADGIVSDDVGGVIEDMDTVSGDMASVLDKAQMFSMLRNAKAVGDGIYVFTSDSTGFKEISGGYNYTAALGNDGKITLTYAKSSGYPEARFLFPDGIELNSLKSIKVNVTSCSSGSVFLKLLNADGSQLKTTYSNSVELTPYEAGGLSGNKIAVTYNGTVADADAVAEIESIELTFYDEKYCNKIYTLAEHTWYSGSDDVYTEATSELLYQSQYQEAKFIFPDYIKNNYANLRNVHFNIERLDAPAGAGASENVAYKVYQTDISNWQNAIQGTQYSTSESVDHAVEQSKITDSTEGLVGIGISNNYSTAGTLTLKVKDVTYTFVDDGNLKDDAPSGGNILDSDAIGGNREEDKYIYAAKDANNFSEIKRRWDDTTTGFSLNESNKTVSLNGTGEWLFTLQEPIDASMVTAIKFAMSDSKGTWAYKALIDGATEDKYNITDPMYTFPVNATGKLEGIVIYSGDADFEGIFHGMMVDIKAAEEPTETYTITVNASALDASESVGGWKNVKSADCTEDKRFKVVFSSAAYSQVRIMLPDMQDIFGNGGKIKLEDCVSVIFNVKEQTGPVNFRTWLGESSCGTWNYNSGKTSYTLIPSAMVNDSQAPANYTGEINAIGVQVSGDTKEDDYILLDSIVFTMKKTADQQDKVYGDDPIDEPIDLTENITPATTSEFDKRYTVTTGGLAAEPSEKVTFNAKDIEKAELKFTGGAWSEIKFALPEDLAAANIKEVIFAISDESVKGLAFKLYDAAGQEVGYGEKEGAGTGTCAITDTSGNIASVAIMLHSKYVPESGDATCLFDGVLFKMNDPDMKTHELNYAADQLELGTVTADAACEKVDGKYVITFANMNRGVTLKLPKIINMANCTGIKVTVSGQTGPVNYYLDLDGIEKDKDYYYPPSADGVHIIRYKMSTGGINELRIYCGGEEYTPNSGITVGKITFTMKGMDETNDFLTGEDADPEPPEVPAATENITPAQPDTVRVTAGELKIAAANVTEWNKTTADQIQITFSGAWSELKLALPETVNLLQCKSVTFAASEQTVPLSFKLYKEGDLDNPVFAQYHQQNDRGLYTFDISSAEQVKYVGIMLHSDDVAAARAALANYCVFDGVMFDIDSDAATDTYTITYPANELTLKSSEAASCELENNNWMIKFSDMDQNVNFKLPASVNLEKCVNIIFTVATQNGPINFNVSLDNSKLKDYYYNAGNTVYTLEPGVVAKINEVGVQCGREKDAYVPGSFVELVSVSFLMKGTEPKDVPADDNYTMDFLEVNTKSTGVTEGVDENGTATITFPKKEDSITYEIPDSVDTNHMPSIQFLPSLSGVRVEVLSAKGKVLASGTDSMIKTNCNPDAKYIRLVSLADNTVLTLNSIKFNIDPNAFEAIVLNGKFDREDVSMWGAALWGSVDGVETTITTKTSDTPITGDIYTYGEISKRNSPYVCFAQDVSDRTEHQTGYIYSFWAKLSDDYKDAPAELRTVTFSPYYIDANGGTNYSMYRTGAYEQVLDPGVWTHFYGVVNLPSGAEGFVIRIVEQGTNYGQGTCVKGSYAVSNVSLTPTDLVPEPSWGGGSGSSGGNRSNTITKEATCEVIYALKDLAIDWASAKTGTENGGLKLSFTNDYDEVRLKLPRTLDMSTCAYVNVSVPAQNVPIAVKLYWKGKQVDVAYYNDIQSVYLMVPEYEGMIDAIGIMSLAKPNPAGAYALTDSITFGLTQEPEPEEKSNSIVINGDFAHEDMSDWSAALWGDGVTITQRTANKPIYGDTYTYASYSRRTSPYQCFAQEITGRVQQNETYTFSFWARLSNDYKNAPENQRVVQFAPYTVDKKGKEDYNPRLEGNYAQTLEPGVWTYFEGTYKVTNDTPISKVMIRILEQGTNYGQGDCVMGSYDVAGVRMSRYIPDPPSIDEDVPNLKDVTKEVFGDDFMMGTAVTVNEMEDLGVEMLVNKHFNAVTIGNELKPDALFNYSNDAHTPLQTITFNGESLEVPTLYYSRAEEILDTLKKWNEDHPEDPIKVRGHVLVWHSQTPEWFFREDYTVGQNADGSENYVTPEVMNLRLEWYIKTVLEHFTGEDSPYKDMFYGWDVVNEAVSNGGNGYRTEKASLVEPLSQSTHSSNSSWWAVYQSNEFILKAFQYANQYAPADVELYYNDYNECDNKKAAGIVKLLNDVKAAEGTRIDGMGMQGHYNMFNPNTADIEKAIRAYAEVVGKVMYTEFDLKVSGDISNDASKEKEYLAQAERYRDIYQLLKRLDAEDGIEIGGFTVWGTVDKYSWLQNSSSVGGGADGTLTQCPLLFDSDYKVKPSYWALVDYTMVDPDWTEEEPVEEAKEETEATPETSEPEAVPETQPGAEPVADTNPVVEEQKKSSAVPIAIGIGAVVIGAGAGAGFYFFKKKKKITK